MLRLAIDTGGTFTDSVLQDTEAKKLWFCKTLSNPSAPDLAVLEGIRDLHEQHPFHLAEISEVLLATTVGTNAILERKGARTALITTAGFRDVLILARAKRYDTYDLHLDKPTPLIARRAIFEVDERMAADGNVVRSLDKSSVQTVIEHLCELEIEAVAVSLLHAYANPDHERAIAAMLYQANPDWPVSVSSTVSPKYREYERTSTTVANAYVTPVVQRFLGTIGTAFKREGFTGEIYVMQSNGGLLTPDIATSLPVNLIESGPAAGVLLGGVVAQATHSQRILTFDMGGTTAKVGALEDGEPIVSNTFEVDAVNLRPWSGLPLNISALELIEIGAGGGSIARVRMGLIEVGPHSAGAEPGPVCYARGGTLATITDANAILGYLAPEGFAGGKIDLDTEAAKSAINEQLAIPLGLDVYTAAWGIHALANANMERALRSMSIERGRDPRDFTLVAFGGAGPVHACRLARALGMPRVIVPFAAGVGSAIGMLAAEPRLSTALTSIVLLDASAASKVRDLFDDLESRALGMLAGAPARWVRHAYLRYRGQGYELRVELPAGEIADTYIDQICQRFHRVYRDAYSYDQPDQVVEATEWHLTAITAGAITTGATTPSAATTGTPADPILHMPQNQTTPASKRRRAYFPESHGMLECEIYDRLDLHPANAVYGPALITDENTTTLVLPGDSAILDESGHLEIRIDSRL